jgi:type IV pilus assembly protein PilA
MNNNYKERGFTLVEIMIVVVIIGLLAAMAIPAFAKVIQQSRLKAVTNNLRQIANSAQQYMLNNGTTQAAYTDIVGTTTDNLINAMNVIAGENYTGIVVVQSQTQVTLSASAFGTVTYNF